MHHGTRKNLQHILIAGVITTVGLFLFKYLPMSIWGKNILFDASGHIASAIFVLYVVWFFIDQNKKWRIPYFIFAGLVLVIISLQRIVANAHNDVGLLGGLLLGIVAIGVSQWKGVKKRVEF